jgi:tetratricopeptide (TPR) repeat protein
MSHPDLETLSSYVDGTLRDRAKANVERHVAECEECLELVREVMAVQPRPLLADTETPGGSREAPTVRRAVMMWAGVSVAVAATLALVALARSDWEFFGPSRLDSRLQRLAAAAGSQRRIEGQLAGGFEYRPFQPVTVGGSTEDVASLALVEALHREAVAGATPRKLHLEGVAQLLLLRHDEAINTLSRASDTQPGEARYPSDLAAAYLARAESRNRVDDLPRALAAVERALSVDPNLAEAWFNRALIAAKAGLQGEARRSWEAYLQRDSTSGWGTEARTRLAGLEPPERE